MKKEFPLLFLICCCFFACSEEEKQPDFFPEVMDDRISINLVEQDPEIVTPIGLAIDSQDDLYVLESHTHVPPKDYAGPEFDRIKKGFDSDQDGQPESWIIFADSIEDGMNLACGPDDVIYLTTKDEVISFQDTDEDGQSDHRKVLLTMTEPENVYDHAGILGLTISPDGWLYVSRGNSGGQAWQIIGTDKSQVSGYGDGGNLMRCRLDGSLLEEVATGFWNPFDIKFSEEGRLMLIDNDPDSRGPNRLLEVVPGGNYGYQSLYGGSGIHPFLAWNGELPGTLPYAAALGEAPSGLIDAGFSNFPANYQSAILVTIWEENSIVWIPLQKQGNQVTGKAQVLVKGDSTFHPVAMAANSKGEIYITDWMVRQYPNHGKGRIWRLSAGGEQPMAAKTGEKGYFFPDTNPLDTFDQLMEALKSEDPFLQTYARHLLNDPAYYQDLIELTGADDPELRLQILLVLSKTPIELSGDILRNYLSDNREDIRRMALIYIAQKSRQDLLRAVDQVLYSGHITPELFGTYLATVRHLQPDFVRGLQTKSERFSKQLKRTLPESFLMSIIKNEQLSPEIRAIALTRLEKLETADVDLIDLLESSPQPMQEALLRVFRKINEKRVGDRMLDIALNRELNPNLRAEALIALQYQSTDFCNEVKTILKEQESTLVETAVKYLCRCDDEAIAKQIDNLDQPAKRIWQLCKGEMDEQDRPTTKDEWIQVVDGSGDPEKGRFIFQSLRTQCQVCHQVDGWGGEFGPDLSHIGSSKTKDQLITAILDPSREISPEWQGWFVKTKEGKTFYGRQIDVGFKNVELMMPTGKFVNYQEPESYGMAPSSLMTEGLEKMLTEAEFNHLISYLISLK